MSTKIAEGIVKLPILPLAYAFAGPFIGAYRGIRRQNTPLNYGRLVSNYPRDGYVAKDWLDWLNGPDDDRPSIFGAMFSAWLGTVTSSLPWLLIWGSVKGVVALRHVGGFLLDGAKTLLYYLPRETLRSTRNFF